MGTSTQKMQKKRPKKVSIRRFKTNLKKKVMLFTFHGVNLKSEIVEKNNFLFRLYLLILPCFEIRKTHFQNIWWTRNFVFLSQKKFMYIFYIWSKNIKKNCIFFLISVEIIHSFWAWIIRVIFLFSLLKNSTWNTC